MPVPCSNESFISMNQYRKLVRDKALEQGKKPRAQNRVFFKKKKKNPTAHTLISS